MVILIYPMLLDGEIKEVEMGGTSDKHGNNSKYM